MEPATFIKESQENIDRLKVKEQMLGKGLCQPFADCNSGSRKLMYAIHIEQSLPLLEPEVPFIMTGYEQRYAERSSSIIKADADYEVVAKISKFQNAPQRHYFLILRNIHNNKLKMLERKDYSYSSETYGYAYDNTVMDNLDIGYEVPQNELVRRSTAYDSSMNPENSVNLLTTYLATDATMEDSIWISETAQKKLSSNLYKKVSIILNDNDMLLNLMGDENTYKSFPLVGERVKDGILCAVRREKIEDCLFTQSTEMLRRILMSDDKYTPGLDTEVIDIDIACNNPELLKEKHSNIQVLQVYNDHLRFAGEFVSTVSKLLDRYGLNIKTDVDYFLGEMYTKLKAEIDGTQFRENKVYSGTKITFMLREISVPSIGDKLANRYGGKGVIAKIVPDEMMPKLALTNEPIEMLVNSSTCINRENIGQWHELSLTHIGKCITDLARIGYFTTDEALHEIVKYLSFASPVEAESLADFLSSRSDEDKDVYLQSIIDSGNIIVSNKPMSESMSLDMLAELWDAFPYVTQRSILAPLKGSNGKTRFVKARRPGVVGHLSMYRLQQYAQEKHSVTALSATNIRNVNSRNKANKYYKSTHQATPINFGDMETGNFGHLGFENVVTVLMIHSVSPHARRLVEKMFTDDPYLVDIKLDEDSSNRSAEILNTYLKTIGYKLVFEKKRKKLVRPFTTAPFTRGGNNHSMPKPFFRIDPTQQIADVQAYFKWLEECDEKIKKRPFLYKPFKYEVKKQTE